ncbi:MAG: hypothetical protein ABIJ46_02665 [bacterium]
MGSLKYCAGGPLHFFLVYLSVLELDGVSNRLDKLLKWLGEDRGREIVSVDLSDLIDSRCVEGKMHLSGPLLSGQAVKVDWSSQVYQVIGYRIVGDDPSSLLPLAVVVLEVNHESYELLIVPLAPNTVTLA